MKLAVAEKPRDALYTMAMSLYIKFNFSDCLTEQILHTLPLIIFIHFYI